MEENNISPTEEIKTGTENTKYTTPMAVTVAGVIVAIAILIVHFLPAVPPQQNGAGTAPDKVVVDIKKVNTTSSPYVGNSDAPVTIAAWEDFQCPFCKRFETDTLPQIMDAYVKTGKVKIVFKDFSFLGNDSITAGVYGRAVWNLYPEKYFVWREAMFKAQDQEGDQGFGNATSIDTLDATIPGIDAAKITADVASNKDAYQSAIATDKAELQTLACSDHCGTPSFIVGKQFISGAVPFATFQQAIDPLLK